MPKRDKYGHDLDKILTKASGLGLNAVVTITKEQKNEIQKANKYYFLKGFEYFDVIDAVRAYPELPDLSMLQQVTSKLVAQLEPICLNC